MQASSFPLLKQREHGLWAVVHSIVSFSLRQLLIVRATLSQNSDQASVHVSTKHFSALASVSTPSKNIAPGGFLPSAFQLTESFTIVVFGAALTLPKLQPSQ